MKKLVLTFVFLFLVTTCKAETPIVVLETNYGDIVIELYKDDTPVTVVNFLDYVNSGFFDGTMFHRVINNFMIQAGAFDTELQSLTPGSTIINEKDNGRLNERGTIAMALSGGDPNSGAAGFYINHVHNTHLDDVHCVFGQVISDMNVVDAIAAIQTVNVGGPFATLPEIPAIIYSARLLGDSDGDGKVDLRDFGMITNQWPQGPLTSSLEIADANIVAQDYFGHSVSIARDYAVAGAPGNVPSGDNAGSVYLYENREGNWQPANQAELTASDANDGDWFGYSVGMNAGYYKMTIVGAPGDDSQTGAAYVFAPNTVDPNKWIQMTRITASDANEGDWFGNSVSMSTFTALIGAYRDNDKTGAAYIFGYDGSEWSELTKLTASDGAVDDKFGNSVSVTGDRVIIGAYTDDINDVNGVNAVDAGSAYIFTKGAEIKLTASDATAGDRFGYSVHINGDYAIVGAVGDDDNGSYSGSAYIFNFNGPNDPNDPNWIQQAKLTPDDGAALDWFGYSVSIDGRYAIVGSRWDDDNGSKSGSAYIFRREGADWVQQSKVTASDGSTNDYFGNSVSLGDGYAIVGAPQANNPGSNSGSAYMFELCPPEDITDDCVLNIDDIFAIVSNWLSGTP